MPRPVKNRKVCGLPACSEFNPATRSSGDAVILSIDEYESVRLIDFEGLSQEECCRYMEVSRTTVQQIYTDARKKIAQALVNGLTLKIEGGNYLICDGDESRCGGGKCRRHRHGCAARAAADEPEKQI